MLFKDKKIDVVFCKDKSLESGYIIDVSKGVVYIEHNLFDIHDYNALVIDLTNAGYKFIQVSDYIVDLAGVGLYNRLKRKCTNLLCKYQIDIYKEDTNFMKYTTPGLFHEVGKSIYINEIISNGYYMIDIVYTGEDLPYLLSQVLKRYGTVDYLRFKGF